MSKYLETAKKQLKKGIVGLDIIKSNLARHLKQEKYNSWLQDRYNEFNTLYPTSREMTYDEKVLYASTYGVNIEDITDFPLIQIDVSITFDEWMKEKNIIQEYVAPTYDEDGNILTEEILEVSELVREYTDDSILDTDLDNLLFSLDKYKYYIEKNKTKELENLTVSTSGGKVFYADAESRQDIADAIYLSQKTGATTTMWKLAKEFNGNKIVEVTLDELEEARELALTSKATIIGVI